MSNDETKNPEGAEPKGVYPAPEPAAAPSIPEAQAAVTGAQPGDMQPVPEADAAAARASEEQSAKVRPTPATPEQLEAAQPQNAGPPAPDAAAQAQRAAEE